MTCYSLKGWLSRKNRRLTPSDAEALKKFAAVESLMEVASSDQQVDFLFSLSKAFVVVDEKN